MDITDWLTLALFFGLGWWAGSRVTAALHRAVIQELLKDLGITSEDLRRVQLKMIRELGFPDPENHTAAREIIEIKIEKHQDQLYAFRKDNDQFLGQGSTAEALVQHMAWRFSNCRLVIDAADGADLVGGHHWQWDHKEKTVKMVDHLDK